MKKAIILAVFAMTVSVASAQKGFHAGIKLIPQNTWIMNKELSDSPFFRHQVTFRFAFGASLAYHFSDRAGVGLDLIYSPQGQKYTVCEGCDEEYLWEVNYFKLPILLHWNSDPDNVAMFVGEFGPQFAFLTNSEDDGINTDEAFKKVNIGLVLGLGVGFNVTDFLTITAKIRLDAGLSDAGAEDEWPEDQRVWMIAGGLPEIGIKYVLRTK